VDWMYARAGIKYSYAAHLRDTGTVSNRLYLYSGNILTSRIKYGFTLPPEYIRPVGEETGKMIEYLAHFIVKNQSTQSPDVILYPTFLIRILE
jgi:hypothetical protein